MLTANGHGQTSTKHQADGWKIVVSGSVGELALFLRLNSRRNGRAHELLKLIFFAGPAVHEESNLGRGSLEEQTICVIVPAFPGNLVR